MMIKNVIHSYIGYRKQLYPQKNEPVKFFNWIGESNGFWFRRFMHDRKILDKNNTSIAFFSLFGDRLPLRLNSSKIKVFFTGENLQRKEYANYNDLCASLVDLALGFEYLPDNPAYLRFPLWILYFIDPEMKYSDFQKFIEQISNPGKERNKDLRFCSLISGHDPNGLRTKMYDGISKIGNIDCPGLFLHNTDELKDKYGNNKIEFLKNYKFNICPENSGTNGYVTEKIFEAVFSKCIPVYWGSENNPEPEILNKDAIIFWKEDGDNSSSLQLINDLCNNDELYRNFSSQPRLQKHADEFIWEMLHQLETHIKKLIK